MIGKSLFVRLQAKPGQEEALAEFLTGALPLAQAEPLTVAWFVVRLDAANFAIFDTFVGEEGREAHINGEIAAALHAKGPVLLARPPEILRLDVLAAKR